MTKGEGRVGKPAVHTFLLVPGAPHTQPYIIVLVDKSYRIGGWTLGPPAGSRPKGKEKEKPKIRNLRHYRIGGGFGTSSRQPAKRKEKEKPKIRNLRRYRIGGDFGTRVLRVTGGNTNHYTTADLLGRLGLESLSSAILDIKKMGRDDLEQLFVSKPNGLLWWKKPLNHPAPDFAMYLADSSMLASLCLAKPKSSTA